MDTVATTAKWWTAVAYPRLRKLFSESTVWRRWLRSSSSGVATTAKWWTAVAYPRLRKLFSESTVWRRWLRSSSSGVATTAKWWTAVAYPRLRKLFSESTVWRRWLRSSSSGVATTAKWWTAVAYPRLRKLFSESTVWRFRSCANKARRADVSSAGADKTGAGCVSIVKPRRGDTTCVSAFRPAFPLHLHPEASPPAEDMSGLRP